MIFKLQAKGHKNVTSHHKSTFEITKDPEIGPTADCIVGTGADKSMLDFPQELKDKIATASVGRLTIAPYLMNSVKPYFTLYLSVSSVNIIPASAPIGVKNAPILLPTILAYTAL